MYVHDFFRFSLVELVIIAAWTKDESGSVAQPDVGRTYSQCTLRASMTGYKQNVSVLLGLDSRRTDRFSDEECYTVSTGLRLVDLSEPTYSFPMVPSTTVG